MNAFDVLLVLLAVSAAIGGYRLGLLTRALSWAGMVLGIIVAARVLPVVLDRLGAEPTGRLLVAACVLLGGAFAGQALGLLVGARARVALPRSGRPLDRIGGIAAGLVGLLVALWLVLPTMADVPGSASRLARGSTIARAIEEVAPDPPDTLLTLRRLVGDNQFPQVFEALRPAPDVGPPPSASGMDPVVVTTAAASIVQVEGRACSRVQDGSGFVVAPRVIVTNAHVVAGEDTTEVILADGSRAEADVVLFDPDRDIALLTVADLAIPPLPIADIEAGGTGAVFGHPGGGPLEISPFAVEEEVEAMGRDLYDRRDTRRQVLILASDLAPGDSGAALVDLVGNVVGVAFAIAPDQAGTAYALTAQELLATLAAPRAAGTDTGPCLS